MKKNTILVLMMVLLLLSACMNDQNIVRDSPLYEGRDLTIGFIGKAPEIREDNIHFKKIELKDLNQSSLSSQYDAIFIMKQHSTEATDVTNQKLYQNVGIPFFYFESLETYMEDTDSAGIHYPQPGYYAAGYYRSGEEDMQWDYGLYNDTVNEANILDVFSRIFNRVETMGNESKRI